MTPFKTLSGKAAHIPSSGDCPTCGIKVDSRQVVLNGGALQQSEKNPKSLYMSDSLSGFLSLSLHSHNSNFPVGTIRMTLECNLIILSAFKWPA
jgi:hypothetical protein